MQVSKKNIYILPEIYHEEGQDTSMLPDRLRDRMGHYWVGGTNSLVYGDEEKINTFPNVLHGTVSYGPVVTYALVHPPFCSKTQTITFTGDPTYWEGSLDPYNDWQAFILDLIPPVDESQQLRDSAFPLHTPLNQQERKILGEMSLLGYADVDFNYNFYISQYETAIQGVQEQLLPNIYAFITDDLSQNMHLLTTMGGIISATLAQIHGPTYEHPTQPPLATSGETNFAAGSYNYFYFNALALGYATLTQEFMNNFAMLFKNFIVPFENLSLINNSSDIKMSFPMFVEVEFSTDSATEIAQILEDSNLSTSLQRQVAAGCGGANLSLLNNIGGWVDTYMVAKENLFYSEADDVLNGSIAYSEGNFKTIDLFEWWTNYLTGLDSEIHQAYADQTFIGPPTYSAYVSTEVGNNTLAQALSLLIFSGKLNGIVKDNLRSYKEMVEGKECHSETILYRVAKYKGTPENNEPIQNYWFPNSNNIDIINCIDTQVKYGSQYTYVVYAYQLTIGTDYRYGPIDWVTPDPPCPDLHFPQLSGLGCFGGQSNLLSQVCVKGDYAKVSGMFAPMQTDTSSMTAVAADIIKIYLFSSSATDEAPILALVSAAYVAELAKNVSNDLGFAENLFMGALAAAIENYSTGDVISVTYPSTEETATTSDYPATTSDYVAYTTVTMDPLVNLVEVPFFSHTGYMVDSPPIAPNVNIIPYRGDNSKILIWLNSSVGDYEAMPIIIDPSEQAHIDLILETNYLSPNDPIHFSSDDIASEFQIFRLMTKPEKYTDFFGAAGATLSTIIDEGSSPPQRASAAEYVDKILPNQKYYYTFRSVDIHNHVSNPTPVYEVQLVDNDGAVYLLINIVPMEEKEAPYDMVKPARRYIYINPSITQAVFNPEASGLDDNSQSALETENYALGVAQQSVWGKKYKVRFISKSTGRKMDLNITYGKEHIVTPTEAALQDTGVVPLHDPAATLVGLLEQ